MRTTHHHPGVWLAIQDVCRNLVTDYVWPRFNLGVVMDTLRIAEERVKARSAFLYLSLEFINSMSP